MENGDHIFLTVPEILESILLDFKQYSEQTELFRKLIPLLYNGNVFGFVVDAGRHEGVWIKNGRKSNPRRIRDDALGDLIQKKLTSIPNLIDRLPEICHLIFQVQTWQGLDATTGKAGIWLDTEMRNFSCRQCGKCCQTLRYHNECRKEDVNRWKALGRNDILRWVRMTDSGKTGKRFSIWIDPATKRRAPVCPWLEPDSNRQHYRCRIHDAKPFVCRQYPGSRKHAIMTGCEGFEGC